MPPVLKDVVSSRQEKNADRLRGAKRAEFARELRV